VNLLKAPEVAGSCPAAEFRFDSAFFHACFTQTPEWKRRHGFPNNVHATPAFHSGSEGMGTSPSDWRRVLVVHPVQVTLALVQTADAAGTAGMMGFWVDPQGWVLHYDRPAAHWCGGWREVFPSLGADVLDEAWQKAWREWCHPRGLPASDVERCVLRAQDHRLIVHSPRRLIERLRALRSDALKSEAWLLAGAGSIRRAALLEVTETGEKGKSPT
jgi:hypothetical protein